MIAAILGAGPVAAQEQPQSGGLEEILVTATRREQNLQDVLRRHRLHRRKSRRARRRSVQDLSAVAPNVVIAGDLASNNAGFFVMRGIPNVGIYIDGIWQSAGFLGNSGPLLKEFTDIERIEVLRGPQGTLYGRDSTGGAIRIYTQPPADEFGFQVDLSLGNYDRRDLTGSLDLPIGEKFLTRFTVGSYDVEGYVTSRVTGFSTGSFEDEALKADMLWTPSDRVACGSPRKTTRSPRPRRACKPGSSRRRRTTKAFRWARRGLRHRERRPMELPDGVRGLPGRRRWRV